MNFPEYLKSIGYKPFRKEFSRGEWQYKPELDNDNHFSTMVNGMLDVRYLKDGIEIVFGKNEADKPPTLIHPRPVGIKFDDEMNRYISNHTNEEIYNEIMK